MEEVTCILQAIEAGDTAAAEQLLPIAYDELRQQDGQRAPVARRPRLAWLERESARALEDC